MNALQVAPALSSFDAFVAELMTCNPFNDQRISATGAQAVDVVSIHDREFRVLADLAFRAYRQNEAVGTVVWGESGSGKSNLLRRLRDWATRGNDAFVVNFLEMQASPDRLHRSLLNALVSVLTRGLRPPWHRTPLFTLIEGMVLPAVPAGKRKLSLKELEEAFRGEIGKILGDAGVTGATRTAVSILERFLIASLLERANKPEAATAAVAVRRLAGDALDEDDARTLGLRGVEAAIPLDASDSVRVLALLTQIARANGKPVIFCFDQIHTLSRQQVIDIAGLMHILNDHVRNTLIVLSEVQEQLQKIHDTDMITQATWDRITANKVEMPRLPLAQGRQILEARLANFLHRHREVPEIKQSAKADPLFPLGLAWFQERTAAMIDVRPRALLRIARGGWDEMQASLKAASNPREWLTKWPRIRPVDQARFESASVESLIDEVIEKALATKIAQHLAAPHGLPPNADNLCALTNTLLARGGVGMAVAAGESGSPYDLVVRVPQACGGETTFGLVFLTTGSATSVTAALRRLTADSKPSHHVILVTDQRAPLALGKSTTALGRTHYQTLKALPNFEHLELSFVDYAGLESLESVARLAADLEIDVPDGKSRPLKRDEVIACYRRTQRFEMHPLLGKFFTPTLPQGLIDRSGTRGLANAR